MNHRECQILRITVYCIVLLTSISIGTLWAGSNSIKLPQQKALTKTNVMPIKTETGDLEIATDLAGKHFWQVSVKNTGNHDAKNFQVIVTVEGFRKEDKVQTVGVISLLKAGHTAYARAELPNFEGMHKMRVKIGGTTKTVEIPRPFRKDANGSPLKGLEIEDAWVRKVEGKIRWYFKTKPNLYDTVQPNTAQWGVYFRQRKHKYCHQEKFSAENRITYIHPSSTVGGPVTNPKAIKPGESVTLYGDLTESTAKPNLPQYIDQLMIESLFSSNKKWTKLDKSYCPESYYECQ